MCACERGEGALGIHLEANEALAQRSLGPLPYLNKRYRQQATRRFPFLVLLLHGGPEHHQSAQGQEVALDGGSMQGCVAFVVHGIHICPSPPKGLQRSRVP